jgi:nucleoside phosphorylase
MTDQADTTRRAVILTALALEYAAVVEHLSGPLTERVVRGLVFDIGRFRGTSGWEVAVAQVGVGNVSAGILLDRAVAAFSPELTMFVGIAGGREGVRHGDVVAADAVYDYETGREGSTGYFPRVKTVAPSFPLVQRAQAVVRQARWTRRIRPRPPRHLPAAYVRPVAAGSKVVADNRSGTAEFLSRYCEDAYAVDMESYGFLCGAYLNGDPAALVVRGISDLLGDKTADNDQEWQVPAARNAAAFAFEVLDTVPAADLGPATALGPAAVQRSHATGGGVVYANQGSGDQIIHR